MSNKPCVADQLPWGGLKRQPCGWHHRTEEMPLPLDLGEIYEVDKRVLPESIFCEITIVKETMRTVLFETKTKKVSGVLIYLGYCKSMVFTAEKDYPPQAHCVRVCEITLKGGIYPFYNIPEVAHFFSVEEERSMWLSCYPDYFKKVAEDEDIK